MTELWLHKLGISRENVRRKVYASNVSALCTAGQGARDLNYLRAPNPAYFICSVMGACVVGLQELAHYALATTDLEYRYPFGWEELWGIANRGDYDLKAHAAASGVPLRYTDTATNEVSICFVLQQRQVRYCALARLVLLPNAYIYRAGFSNIATP